MKTKKVKVKYDAWLSPEIMHNASRKWLSELEFAKDEELFFDDLVKSYTLQLIDSKHFSESKKIVDRLSKIQKETEKLIEIVKTHEVDLKIMVDGINQLAEEDAYRKEHGKLIIIISEFLEKYRTLKTELFTLVKGVIKEGKQKRLLQ
ncbi:hypothetical protein MBM09_08255 [Flaviramulus sp. BrNp1-15]|uniref:hypothetical protein n=1 Tax=Flaviramulus sp. BrNp1-15 TaxID=2916754 RepID=UPI001EE90336|nr:hypothetical protein [Flaviramulus sp. BrNp1-15]ULC57911.1 hypothetical protein MBM09_08255 [Flaviramulus sp. BrNp1-15]